MVKRVKSVADLDRLAVSKGYRVPPVFAPRVQAPPAPVEADMSAVKSLLAEMEKRLVRQLGEKNKSLLSTTPRLQMRVTGRDGRGDIETVEVTLVTH